ncbi:MAG: tetratricopeptide repeat protein [Candidatus Eisenbacteria sp.]|nr:tetratricopeptide repeat protein [Candidatus Eisenbacteria bacterium]
MEQTAKQHHESPPPAASGTEPARPDAGAATYWRWLVVALVLGIGLRILGWFLLRNAFFCGSPGFLDAVHELRIERLLGYGFPETALPTGSPIYPYFGALLGLFTGGRVDLILLVQSLLGAAAIPLIGWAFRPLLGPRARGIAVLCYALHPLFVIYGLRLDPMIPALLLLLLAVRLVFLCQQRSLPTAVIGGGVLGLGFLFAPLPFAALTLAAVWRRFRGGGGAPTSDETAPSVRRPHPALSAAALLLAALLLPGLLCVHNAALPGGGPTWNWTDAHSLHRTMEPETWGTARSQEPPVWQTPAQAQTRANEALGRSLDEWGATSYYRTRGLQRIAEQPLRWIVQVLRRGALLLSAPEIPDPVSVQFVLTEHAKPLLWGIHIFPIFLGLGLIGLWSLRNQPYGGSVKAIMIALLAANLLGCFSAASRLHLLLVLLPVSAAGLATVPRLVRALRTQPVAQWVLGGAVILALLSYLDLPDGRARFENRSEDLRYAANILQRETEERRGATNLLRQALRVDPQNVAAHTDLGELLAQEDLPDAARESFQAALAINPEYAAALYGLAEICRSETNYAAAESLLTQLITLHPQHPLYLNQLATVLVMAGKLPLVRPLLVKALELDPEYDVARSNLRMIEDTRRQAQALGLPAEIASQIDPRIVELGSQAVQALRAMNMGRADSLTALGLQQYPDSPLAWYMRGALLSRTGRPQEAMPLLMRLLEIAPGRGMITEMVVQAFITLDRRVEGRALAEEQLAKAPDERNRLRIKRLIQQLDTESAPH